MKTLLAFCFLLLTTQAPVFGQQYDLDNPIEREMFKNDIKRDVRREMENDSNGFPRFKKPGFDNRQQNAAPPVASSSNTSGDSDSNITLSIAILLAVGMLCGTLIYLNNSKSEQGSQGPGDTQE